MADPGCQATAAEETRSVASRRGFESRSPDFYRRQQQILFSLCTLYTFNNLLIFLKLTNTHMYVNVTFALKTLHTGFELGPSVPRQMQYHRVWAT
jgi:hypothetical protein